MLFNFDFTINTILSCFFFFFLIIEFYFLIAAVIAKTFNSIAELVIPIETPTKEAKAEMEIHPVIAEPKKESVQCNLELYKPFCVFYSSIHFDLFLQLNNLISCCIYIFQSRLLTYVFFCHVFKVIIYFQLNQEF